MSLTLLMIGILCLLLATTGLEGHDKGDRS